MYEETAAKRNRKFYQETLLNIVNTLTDRNGGYMDNPPWVGALHMPTRKRRRKCPTRRVDPTLVLIACQILVWPKCRN